MTHRINHAELEVIVGDRAVGEQLLERLSLLRERRIAPLIDRVCSELSGPERFDRIERIELELGPVALTDFDDDFIRKLEAALRGALAKAVPAQADAQARVQAALELLEIFAWTGNLPWWADASCSDPVRAQIEALTDEAPRALLELLGELAKNEAALARVLRHADARALPGPLRGEVNPSTATRLGEAIERTLDAEPDSSEEPDRERVSLAKPRAGDRNETLEMLRRELTRAHRLERAEAEHHPSVSLAVGDEQAQAEKMRFAERAVELLRDVIAAGLTTLAIEPLESQGSETFETVLRELADDERLHAWVLRELERASSEQHDDGREPPPWSDNPLLHDLAEQPQLAERLHVLLQAPVAANRAAFEGGRPSNESNEQPDPEGERSETLEAVLRELVEQPRLSERLHALLQTLVAAGRAELEINRSSEQQRSSLPLGGTVAMEPDRQVQPDAEPTVASKVAAKHTSERSESFEALLRELVADQRLHAWVVSKLERASIELVDDSREPTTSSEQARETASLHALLLNRIIAAGRANAAALIEHSAQARAIGSERRQHARAEPPADGQARAARSSGARTPDRPAPARAARRRAVERLEELYVDNAGLVLLWPFLARFFARVGLLDDKQRFIDEPARMQAIALLELVAREDLEPPEFRLPLAKLLCGLAPIDEYELERPLAPEQIDECEHLLVAVIDNAPILRAMSVPSFRASFLQRGAVLCTRDGQWLLQVERANYDVVLERFPWSWDWLKLPWMPDALRVEW